MKIFALVTVLFLPVLWLIFKLTGYNDDLMGGFWNEFQWFGLFLFSLAGIVLIVSWIQKKKGK